MIAVIVLSGPFEGMHGLDVDRSPALLPLVDRPTLQHIVESLVTQGITQIELVVGHGPAHVELLLGSGDRWGCHFRYHLAAQPDRPYRSLKVIAALAEDSWVLIHAERFPCVDLATGPISRMCPYYGPFGLEQAHWGGTILMPPGTISDEMASFSEEEMETFVADATKGDAAEIIITDEWIDVTSPQLLLDSQARLLEKKLRGLMISGVEREPGIWVARNATIHPSVRLTAPLYIGTNTRLERGVKVGPLAVIGPDCIVDSKTTIDNALIMDGSYVGEGLEVHQAIVAHNLLVNVRLDARVDIEENFLLGRLEQPRPSNTAGRLFQSLLATVLLVVFSPVLLLSWLIFKMRGIGLTRIRAVCLPANERASNLETFSLLCFGADIWKNSPPAGWTAFMRQFLPGLIAAAKGNLGLVGLPPRTPDEVALLDEDWRELYINQRAGLITEASVAGTDSSDTMQLYLAEAYYNVQKGPLHKLALMLKYFGRLIFPAKPH